jgi:hypothetical protein
MSGTAYSSCEPRRSVAAPYEPDPAVEGDTLPKLRKPRPFNLVDVRRIEEARRVQERVRKDIQWDVAMAALFFPAIPMAYIYMELTDSGRPFSFSSGAIPLWIALLVVAPMCVAAFVLAVMSVVGSSAESRKDRRRFWAFMLALAGIVILWVSS